MSSQKKLKVLQRALARWGLYFYYWLFSWLPYGLIRIVTRGLLAVAFVFVVLALVRPAALSPLNKLWFQFGLLLGKIVTPVVMSLVFFLTVLPTGIIMRLLGKDLLNRKIDRSAPSYWVKREDPVGSMRNQF